MTTIRHGGPSALRIEMRSDERPSKSVGFHAAQGRMVFAARSEGGVRHDSDKKCGKAAFLYLSHSAVVIPFESARPLPTREKGGDESDPPQSGGACDLG